MNKDDEPDTKPTNLSDYVSDEGENDSDEEDDPIIDTDQQIGWG